MPGEIMDYESAGYTELPRTAYLDCTLRRARSAAAHRSHRYVTLEHLLLALLDDPDAVKLVRTVGADAAAIQAAIAAAVNHKMAALTDPSGRAPAFSYKFDSLFLSASGDAIRLGRKEVCSALALIAIAKDPESNASAILAANGFNPQAALHVLAAAPPRAAEPVTPLPASSQIKAAAAPAQEPLPHRPWAAAAAGAGSRLAPVAEAPAAGSRENLVQDMLTSVRNILAAEERKERGLPPAAAASPLPAPSASQPFREPQLPAEAAADRQRSQTERRAQALFQEEERIDPGFSLAPQPRAAALPADRRAPDPDRPGFLSPRTPGAGLKVPAAPQPREKQRKERERKISIRGASEAASLLTKITGGIPRKARLGRAETVQIHLTGEEAGLLFSQLPGHERPSQGGEAQPSYRAVTVRLSAPGGGFFIAPSAPETQWLSGRSSFVGEAPFGTWAWTAIPCETGPAFLSVSIFAREVDGNGILGDSQIPQQAIKVRIYGNLASRFWVYVRTLLLLAAGGALAVLAIFGLAQTGQLPHWFVPH